MDSTSLQPLHLAWGGKDITLPVPGELLQLATEVSERFAASSKANDVTKADQTTLVIEGVAHFMGYVVEQSGTNSGGTTGLSPHQALIRSILQTFETEYLKGRSIYAVLQDEHVPGPERRLDIIRCYYAAVIAASSPITPWYSALLKAAEMAKTKTHQRGYMPSLEVKVSQTHTWTICENSIPHFGLLLRNCYD